MSTAFHGGMTAESVTSRLSAALDRTWSQIRTRHVDVPEVVITLGSGPEGNGPLRLEYFADGRRQRGPAGELPEMFVCPVRGRS